MKRLIFILAALLFTGAAGTAVCAETVPVSDVIILMDVSGSMLYTDPERAAPLAVNGLIDRVAEDGGRAGLITFSGTLKHIQPLTELSDEAVRNNLKQRVSRAVYNGYTDIGLVLRRASEMLNGESNRPMILLFTDGMIEISPNTYRRTAEQSMTDTVETLDALAGIASVYAVGLDTDGRVDRELLTLVTGGDESKMRIASEADELAELFLSVYETHTRAGLLDVTVTSASSIEPLAPLPPEAPAPSSEPPPSEPPSSSEESSLLTEPAGVSPPEVSSPEPGEAPSSAAASPEPPPDTSLSPTESDEPSPPEPTDPTPWRPNAGILLALAALVITAVAVNARWLLRAARKSPMELNSFTFDLTLITPLGGEKIPTVSLDAEIGGDGITLGDLINAAFGEANDYGLVLGGVISEVRILSRNERGKPVIILVNESGCEISDSTDTILTKKKIKWREHNRLTFSCDNEITRIEITYSLTPAS